jgi:hypothetical protein
MGYIHPVPNSETKEEKREARSKITAASERKAWPCRQNPSRHGSLIKKCIASPFLGEGRKMLLA